ncbi:MAG: hypothetical protein AUJ92_02435 [Armatimonadetes bacterium CG2_30_59_28]|nr:hypothetical protein [Armatimonadota bacterium]OIO97985.1 MAG: hypothetical protein AUJ92_02435 [Armatimonadetes bacterium CG2_30_59_28]PIU64337.1 MAG: hypothetical protein COS85_12795 [Armatimonadetes bacterium CG07_land_8_20_14_0_80_59_28]PIY44458.1 MAG: hypothetical protein COZ05_08115 [Armatimonadetes bacterium CG_4_10_14_3_um_filter_59_10]PJB76250.1 MAG: hypothetical protein CO095_02805 [Armatimonadetes bacterium CG_4_9_14_3_um_filter_58_7]
MPSNHPDPSADMLLRRCLILSLSIHFITFGTAVPVAYIKKKPNQPLSLTIIDLKEPVKRALEQIERETQPTAVLQKEKSVDRNRPVPKPTPVAVLPINKPVANAATQRLAVSPKSQEMGSKRAALPSASPKPDEKPFSLLHLSDKLPGDKAVLSPTEVSSLPGAPLAMPRMAMLPSELATDSPGRPSLPEEVPGGGAKGFSPQGKMLPRAPGPLPFDPNDSGGAKTAPGGVGSGAQTPMGRGVPIGKQDAALPYNPQLASLPMGGGRSGLGILDSPASGGGVVDPLRRDLETVFLNGGGGGSKNLPKARPRIGGGGGAPIIFSSSASTSSFSARSGTGGRGPGSGGGVGYGIGTGVGFSRGAGIGLSNGQVPLGALNPGTGSGIGQGIGDGIGIGTASRAGGGESGPGTGESAGYGYGRGGGVGVGNGVGGSKYRPKFVGLPLGEPGGMVGGTGKGGGIAGSGPGGPGYGIGAAGLGRGSGGGRGGIGSGYGGGIGFGYGGGGAGRTGTGIGSGIGAGTGGGGAGGGGGGGLPGAGEVAGLGGNGQGGGGKGVAPSKKTTPGRGGGDKGMTLTRGFVNRGLKGQYYDDPKRKPGDYQIDENLRPVSGQRISWPTFSSLKHTRTDAHVNFHWNQGEPNDRDPESEEAKKWFSRMESPAPGVGSCYFSIRWTGKFYVPEDNDYTFYLDDLDDGGRLWIDGAPVIDRWYIQRSDSASHPRHLSKGIHDIKLEYCQGPEWMNSIVLSWKGRNFAKEVIGPAKKVAR